MLDVSIGGFMFLVKLILHMGQLGVISLFAIFTSTEMF